MSSRDRSVCPDPNELAAFVQGNLEDAARQRVAAHLTDCSECVKIAGATLALLQEEAAADGLPFRRWGWIAAAAAAVTIVVSVTLWQRPRERDPLDRLRAISAGLPERGVEGRLADFAHAPFVDVRSGAPADRAVALRAAAERLAAADNTDAETMHARGVSLLLTGSADEAVRALSAAAARAPGDARIWNDLSVAWISIAAQRDHARFLDAAAAAERAIVLAPDLASAHFNRAVALEHLGRHDEASRSYGNALALERDPRWRDETVQRRAYLQP